MGYSDNILRFIAERGDSGQLNHVENIDKAYGLKELQVRWVHLPMIFVVLPAISGNFQEFCNPHLPTAVIYKFNNNLRYLME